MRDTELTCKDKNAMGLLICCSTNTNQPTTHVDVCGMGWKTSGNSEMEPDMKRVKKQCICQQQTQTGTSETGVGEIHFGTWTSQVPTTELLQVHQIRRRFTSAAWGFKASSFGESHAHQTNPSLPPPSYPFIPYAFFSLLPPYCPASLRLAPHRPLCFFHTLYRCASSTLFTAPVKAEATVCPIGKRPHSSAAHL